MRIMVFDVPAESGGALSVLHEFYNEFKIDQENEYIFVLSLPELKETSNIKIIRFPWIKKSWGHRLYFDHFIAPKLITKYKVDKVLSLQNITIPHTKIYQSVFVHNALPFSQYRFSLKEDRLLWVYQNIIGRKIRNSIKKADRVIVQAEWMKQTFIKSVNVSDQKIEVKKPSIAIQIKKKYNRSYMRQTCFFYPASGVFFKNHKVIVDACKELKNMGITNYRIILTLSKDENKNILRLLKEIKANNLPIEFVGNLTRGEVFDMYSKSILLFPSYIETVGLPLVEAMLHDSPILVSNLSFAHEILDGYLKVSYFNPFDSAALSLEMKKNIDNLNKD